MRQIAELRDRVTRLEERMDDVHEMASRTDREVANWRTTLNNHTKALNAMGDKIDLFQERVDERFAKVDEHFAKLEGEMRKGFAKVDANFAKVEDKFAMLHEGQERITALLTRHLSEPDEETRPGDNDE